MERIMRPKPPVCEKCGNNTKLVGIQALSRDSDDIQVCTLHSSVVKEIPYAHVYSYQCQHCIPPYIDIKVPCEEYKLKGPTILKENVKKNK
jgi:hypothetical protein